MASTSKWQLEKPIRTSLYWDVPLNANFDTIDTILYKLRTSFAGSSQPTENSDNGSLWFDSLSSILNVKYASGYKELLTLEKADGRYVKLGGGEGGDDGGIVFTGIQDFSNASLRWFDIATNNIAHIYFSAAKHLTIDFGDTPGTDKMAFRWTGTDGGYEILELFSNRIVASKNINSPNATDATHLITKGQCDAAYVPLVNYTAADVLSKIKTVDGSTSGLDADVVDSFHASKTPAANTIPVSETDGKINNAWINLTGLDADKVDGKHASEFQLAMSDTDVLNKIKNVDGTGSGLDADTVDGKHADEFTPVGTVVYVAYNTAPTGWLKCNGAAISRTTYADLFTKIGTTFGVGNGSTTFNLPDLRGEFIRGWDDGRGVDSGRTFGSAQAQATGPHNHDVAYGVGGYYPTAYGGYVLNSKNYTATNQALNTGTGIGTETRPRNISLLPCIKY